MPDRNKTTSESQQMKESRGYRGCSLTHRKRKKRKNENKKHEQKKNQHKNTEPEAFCCLKQRQKPRRQRQR